MGCALSVREWLFNTGRGAGKLGPRFSKKLRPPICVVRKIATPFFWQEKELQPATMISQPPLPVINDHSLIEDLFGKDTKKEGSTREGASMLRCFHFVAGSSFEPLSFFFSKYHDA